MSLQYHEVLLLSQCYCVVDSTIVPPSINVRFVTINVCVSVRSSVLIVSDIAIIRFDSANPPGYFRTVFASCLFLTSQRQGLYPWVPPRLQRLSQSTSCRSNSVTHHHSLEIEDCVLFWLPRTNFIGFFMRLCRGLLSYLLQIRILFIIDIAIVRFDSANPPGYSRLIPYDVAFCPSLPFRSLILVRS